MKRWKIHRINTNQYLPYYIISNSSIFWESEMALVTAEIQTIFQVSSFEQNAKQIDRRLSIFYYMTKVTCIVPEGSKYLPISC